MAKPIACPNCQYINAGSAAFCGNCGHSLVMPAASSPPAARCPHCGAANPAEAVFCGVCGRRVQVAPRTNRRSTIILLVLLIGGLATAAVTGVYYLSTRAGAAASAANGGEGNEGNPVGGEPDAPTDETIPVTPEASETPSPTVTASLTYTPVATVTPFPTNTSRPTFTPLPTRTPTPPTPLPTPSRTATVTPMAATSAPPVACREDPGPRWGPTIWDRYKDILGCAVTGEIRGNAAYQPYQRGMMVWREDAERVYVLYNNGSYASYPAEGPKDFYVSDWVKGSFGYLWTNNAGVRDRVGQATAAEFNATDFAAQDFAGGTIFYFFENNAHNYALFKESGTWVSAQE